MYRLFAISVLFLAGCTGNLVGPFAPRTQRADDPCLPISEQERRGRDQLSLIDESTIKMDNLSPRTYTDRPSPSGR